MAESSADKHMPIGSVLSAMSIAKTYIEALAIPNGGERNPHGIAKVVINLRPRDGLRVRPIRRP